MINDIFNFGFEVYESFIPIIVMKCSTLAKVMQNLILCITRTAQHWIIDKGNIMDNFIWIML